MDKLIGVEVRHAVCDLASHLDHFAQAGRCERWIILLGSRRKKKDTRENLGIFPTPRSFRVCQSSFVQPEHPKPLCEESRMGSGGGRGAAL